MEELKVTDDPSNIGLYSGSVDSIFALAQLFTTYQWGKLSDRIGRRPVLMMGLSGVVLSTTCFGLSNSLWAALISRSIGMSPHLLHEHRLMVSFVAGALSGNNA